MPISSPCRRSASSTALVGSTSASRSWPIILAALLVLSLISGTVAVPQDEGGQDVPPSPSPVPTEPTQMGRDAYLSTISFARVSHNVTFASVASYSPRVGSGSLGLTSVPASASPSSSASSPSWPGGVVPLSSTPTQSSAQPADATDLANTATNEQASGSGTNKSLTIGLAVGLSLGLVLAAALAVVMVVRNKRKQYRKDFEQRTIGLKEMAQTTAQ